MRKLLVLPVALIGAFILIAPPARAETVDRAGFEQWAVSQTSQLRAAAEGKTVRYSMKADTWYAECGRLAQCSGS